MVGVIHSTINGLNMKRLLTAFCLIILFNGTFLLAQGELKGKVSDAKDNTALRGVNIFIPDLQRGTITDENGNYTISGIPSGSFSVQFSYVGYKSFVKKTNITNTTTELNVELNPTEIHLGDVVVVGNSVTLQEKLPYRIESLDKQEMVMKGGVTLSRSLALLPGISTLSNGLGIGRPVVRGMSGYRVVTLIDGLKFDNQQWQEEHGFGPDETGIGRINIIEGPASLLYGAGAMGGVIDIQRENNAPVGHVTGNYSLRVFSNTLGASSSIGLKGAGKKWTWQLHLGGESQADYLDGRNIKVPNTRFAGLTAKGMVGYNSASSVTTFQYEFSHHIYGVVEQKDLNNPKDMQEDHFERGFEGPHHIIDFHIISLENYFFVGSSKIKINVGFQNNSRKEDEGTELTSTGTAPPRLDLLLNTLSYNVQWINSYSDDGQFTMGTSGSYKNNKNKGTRILIPDADISNAAVFGYVKQNFSPVTLEGGLRYDYNKIKTTEMGIKNLSGYMPALDLSYNTLNGAFGGSVSLTNNLSAKLNFSTGFRSPNLAELSSNGVHEGTYRYEIGNANMKTEKNLQLDAGLSYQANSFSMYASYFRNRVLDYIYLQPTAIYVGPYSIYHYRQSDALLYGGEVSLNYKPAAWVLLKASYSTVTGDKDDGSYLPFMPADKIIGEVNFYFEDLSLFKKPYAMLRTRDYFKQDKISTNETQTPGYNLIDAALGANIFWNNKPISVSLAVNNVFSETYAGALSLLRPIGVNDIGRNIILSVSYPFNLK